MKLLSVFWVFFERGSFRYLGYIVQGDRKIDDDVARHIGVEWSG